MAYLDDYPPRQKQFRPRRAEPSGAVVVHTAEGVTDLVLPDSGAEAVARFIRNRTTYGSYHELVDSDSRINVVDYRNEAYGEGTGGNRWALHLSFACRADQWATLPEPWVAGALDQAMESLTRFSTYLATHGKSIPPSRLSAAQYRSGMAGFVTHGQLDPGRRTDPGAQFPWTRFLAMWKARIGPVPPARPPIPKPPSKPIMEGLPMPTAPGETATLTGAMNDARAFIQTAYWTYDKANQNKWPVALEWWLKYAWKKLAASDDIEATLDAISTELIEALIDKEANQ